MGVTGMFAAMGLPEGLAFPYLGLVFDRDDLIKFEASHKLQFSRTYAKGAPGRRVIFGQFAKHSTIAAFINCTTRSKAHANCHWGKMKLTQPLLDANPALSTNHGLKTGDAWPCIRTSRIIGINEELLLPGYGPVYWGQFKREKNYVPSDGGIKLYKLHYLKPRIAAAIARMDASNKLLRRQARNPALKRARQEEANAPPAKRTRRE
jgi:hypothetical protein